MNKASAIILINSENKILLQLRDDKPEIYYPNHWGLIGGGVEEGENELEAIKREINEEINCDIIHIEELGKIFHEKENILLTIFLGKIDKEVNEIKLSEGQEVRFFNSYEIPSLKMSDLLKEFIIKNNIKIFNI